MQSEVENTMSRTKYAFPSAYSDNVYAEELSVWEEFGAKHLTWVMNEIYDTGPIPTDLLKSVFVVLPRKSGAIDCEAIEPLTW